MTKQHPKIVAALAHMEMKRRHPNWNDRRAAIASALKSPEWALAEWDSLSKVVANLERAYTETL